MELKELWKKVKKYPNVIAYSGKLQPRIRKGKVIEDELCFRVYVTKKLPEVQLSPQHVIPKSLKLGRKEIPTDVVEQGEVIALSIDKTKKHRPCPAGCSIGHYKITAGTLGWFAEDKEDGEIVIVSNNHVLACFSEDTYVFTREGFKLFKEVTYDDEIATLNQDGFLEYQKPTDIIVQEYHGDMLHFEGKGFDILCTPNHKLFVAKEYIGRKSSYPFEFVEARNVTIRGTRTYRFKKDCKWKGTEAKQVSDEYIRLIGWMVTEGSLAINPNPEYMISIRQTNETNKLEIANIFLKLGYNPHICKGAVIVNNKQLFRRLNAEVGRRHSKRIPQYVKDLPPKKLEVLLDALTNGDGCPTKHGEINLMTKSWRLANDYMEILLKTGRSFRLEVRKGSPFNPNGTYYYIWSIEKRLRPVLRRRPRIVKYSGKVYCVTVPNHTILVMRNGKPVWVGNCENKAKSGDPILQPGPYDGGTLSDQIAKLKRFVPLKFSEYNCKYRNFLLKLKKAFLGESENKVDIACASPLNPEKDIKIEIVDIGLVRGKRTPKVGDKVQKSGRTTCHTLGGEVIDDAWNGYVWYSRGKCFFVDQILISKKGFSAGGDSGSLILDMENNAVAWLFAGSDLTTVGNKIENVEKELNVEVLTFED